MHLILDVAYQTDTAKVVGGFFEKWSDETLVQLATKTVSHIQPYISGEFYKRELPCLLDFLQDCSLSKLNTIIIDGFVCLDDEGKKGLGGYLYEHLSGQIPIIGVAKTNFHNNVKHVSQVYRGNSKKPLYVSAIGIHLQQAADCIKNMYGQYRLPHLIKQVDTKTKMEE